MSSGRWEFRRVEQHGFLGDLLLGFNDDDDVDVGSVKEAGSTGAWWIQVDAGKDDICNQAVSYRGYALHTTYA